MSVKEITPIYVNSEAEEIKVKNNTYNEWSLLMNGTENLSRKLT